VTQHDALSDGAAGLIERRLPPITELAVATMIVVVIGGIYLAAHIPGDVSLAPAVALLIVAGVLVLVNLAALTRVGEFCGTFVYASPEQIRGEEVDARSDLYSLAIVFYKMLTGSAPFTADNDYVLMTAQLEKAPPPLAGRVPGLDPRTEAAVRRALAQRADDRFASVGELALLHT